MIPSSCPAPAYTQFARGRPCPPSPRSPPAARRRGAARPLPLPAHPFPCDLLSAEVDRSQPERNRPTEPPVIGTGVTDAADPRAASAGPIPLSQPRTNGMTSRPNRSIDSSTSGKSGPCGMRERKMTQSSSPRFMPVRSGRPSRRKPWRHPGPCTSRGFRRSHGPGRESRPSAAACPTGCSTSPHRPKAARTSSSPPRSFRRRSVEKNRHHGSSPGLTGFLAVEVGRLPQFPDRRIEREQGQSIGLLPGPAQRPLGRGGMPDRRGWFLIRPRVHRTFFICQYRPFQSNRSPVHARFKTLSLHRKRPSRWLKGSPRC